MTSTGTHTMCTQRTQMLRGCHCWLMLVALGAFSPLAAQPYRESDPGVIKAGSSIPFIVVTGEYGSLLHVPSPDFVPTEASPDGEHLPSPADAGGFAVAVGAGGLLLRWDGQAWDRVVLADGPNRISEVWAASDHSVVLYGGTESGRYRVCSRIDGVGIQPFCRVFDAPIRGACGNRDGLQIILGNGEIYRLNDALISPEGRFEPAFRPEHPLALGPAWVTDAACASGSDLPEVYAVDLDGAWLRFDGSSWRSMAEPPAAMAGAGSRQAGSRAGVPARLAVAARPYSR